MARRMGAYYTVRNRDNGLESLVTLGNFELPKREDKGRKRKDNKMYVYMQ